MKEETGLQIRETHLSKITPSAGIELNGAEGLSLKGRDMCREGCTRKGGGEHSPENLSRVAL